ncbi:protocadherin beta-1-like [Gigantopelta aegis]|uniref:protocadherin beta-1-like n=1 Tax=Gigantopelta aegis TaxID=1735272 RepID=UPI001B8877F6|nr:protocadherin beta-1-like [Gigantopelta aegis]
MVVYMCLLWTFLVTLCSTLTDAQEIIVEFTIAENMPSGFYVGSVATKSGIEKDVPVGEFSQLRYNFLSQGITEVSSIFSINPETGDIYTVSIIDREATCAFQIDCVIDFEVAVTSLKTSYFQIITVSVTITDVNDNPPEFSKDVVTLLIPESVTIGTSLRLEGATDKDKGKNHSKISYELASTSNKFGLHVEERADGTSSLRIVVRKRLDRERKTQYKFYILAKNTGYVPLIGNLTVIVKVTDVNDCPPVFSKKVYDYVVAENTPIGSTIGHPVARDNDEGANANVTYRFDEETDSDVYPLFSIDKLTGFIRVKGKLQYEAGKHFKAFVEATDQGEPPLDSQTLIRIYVRDVGNDPPRIHINPVSSGVGDLVILSEAARVGTVLAHIKVTDRDQGRNGEVNCSSKNPLFSVRVLEGRGYIIQLDRKLDREVMEEINVTVVCVDSGSPSLSAQSSFMLRVTDENDNAPVFTQQIYIFNISENNRKGEIIGRVSAVDSDIGTNAKSLYFLSAASDSLIRIDHQDGYIVINDVLDREKISHLSFDVMARDEGDPPCTGRASIVINVLDANDNRPQFVNSSLEFSVTDDMLAGSSVGKLLATDADSGRNAQFEFLMLVRGELPPFVVFSDGMIRTDRTLNWRMKKRYQFEVLVKDKGTPPLNSTGVVVINILRANHNAPVIIFPFGKNNSVTITSDMEPGSYITRIHAIDRDDGINGNLSYSIAGGNKDNVFEIKPTTGEVFLTRRLGVKDAAFYTLTVSVQDHGNPQKETQQKLNIAVVYVNVTATMADRSDIKYIVISGVVGGVTIVMFIVVVTVILYLKRSDTRRRARHSVAVQEHNDTRDFEKHYWHSVPGDDSSGSADDGDKNIDSIPKGDKTMISFESGPDTEEPYLRKVNSDHYGAQHFYTFRKCPSHTHGDDLHSDSSGEVTASDSGRGGSVEDIQLPILTEVEGEDSGQPVHYHRAKRKLGSHTNKSKPADGREGLFQLESLVPKVNPADHCRHQESLMTNTRTVGIYSPCASALSFDDPTDMRRTTLEKRVTFAKEPLTRTNLKTFDRYYAYNNGSPPNTRADTASRNPRYPTRYNDDDFSQVKVFTNLSRVRDDDENTTTSGSYTIGSEDIDGMFVGSSPVM